MPWVWCSRRQQQNGLRVFSQQPCYCCEEELMCPRDFQDSDPKDQLTSTLTWKGLWISVYHSHIVLSSLLVIIYAWTHSCTVWFVYKKQRFLRIPFPRPSWQHTAISQQRWKCVSYLLKRDQFRQSFDFIFYTQNDKRTENCFTKGVWISLPCEECYQLVLVLLMRRDVRLFSSRLLWTCSSGAVTPEHKAAVQRVIQSTELHQIQSGSWHFIDSAESWVASGGLCHCGSSRRRICFSIANTASGPQWLHEEKYSTR